MISNKLVQIELPPVASTAIFDITTVDGRDQIADQIKLDIDEYSRQALDEGPRTHLGVSEIGHKCPAYLWYKFRWTFFESFNGRMLRLFRRGHLEENKFVELLTAIGFEVKQTEIDGKQIRVARSIGDHFGGSADSKTVLPVRYRQQPIELLLEYKTVNDKWFKPMYGMGVQKANDKYWTQLSVYAYKLGLRYVLFIAVNKNDDDLNIELIEADWNLAIEMERKAEYIITASSRPVRLSENPSYYECRWCAAVAVCHYNAPKLKNCRSCINSKPSDNASWVCTKFNSVIPPEFIPKGCDAWQPIC